MVADDSWFSIETLMNQLNANRWRPLRSSISIRCVLGVLAGIGRHESMVPASTAGSWS